MFRSRSSFFSFVVITLGLALTIWWMSSTEETVLSRPHKVSFDKNTTVAQNKKVVVPITPKEGSPNNTFFQKRKISELQEILDSKNDNDPRLDSDFKTLSDSEKKALQEKYLSYVPEKLNERGTLVFLLGRNIENEKDLRFMEYVLNEKPCLSMADCSNSGPKEVGEAAHLAPVDEVTLVYPQVVGIKSIENSLADEKFNPQLRSYALKSLEAATHSSSAIVAHLAASTLRKISP